MDIDTDSVAHSSAPVPRVPAWALPTASASGAVEAAFMAGSALNCLDNLVRSQANWHGAWRQRLALKAAAAWVSLMGGTEDERALRDAWYLRQPGDEPGPAGNVLAAWRRLAARSTAIDRQTLESVAELLGVGWSDSFAPLIESARKEARSGAPAPLVAARVANAVVERQPKAEALAWWLADFTLSMRMHWPMAVPLLATQIHSPVLRFGPDRIRCKPGHAEFERAVLLAVATGSAEACRLAAAIDRQARRLREMTPKLRSKGAGEVIDRLLSDDAVPGALSTQSLSRWASRRLFGRLMQLDAVRELTGRDTFQLYGL